MGTLKRLMDISPGHAVIIEPSGLIDDADIRDAIQAAISQDAAKIKIISLAEITVSAHDGSPTPSWAKALSNIRAQVRPEANKMDIVVFIGSTDGMPPFVISALQHIVCGLSDTMGFFRGVRSTRAVFYCRLPGCLNMNQSDTLVAQQNLGLTRVEFDS